MAAAVVGANRVLAILDAERDLGGPDIVIAVGDDIGLGILDGGRLDPGFEGDLAGEVESGRVLEFDVSVGAIEGAGEVAEAEAGEDRRAGTCGARQGVGIGAVGQRAEDAVVPRDISGRLVEPQVFDGAVSEDERRVEVPRAALVPFW